MTDKQLGRPAPSESGRSTWVQTERAAHEAWARLITRAPMAARLAHVLVANMDPSSNAVVASQSTIGELMGGVHRNTVRKAIQVLEAERWIEVLQIGGKGGALAYVVNSRVAWGQSREAIRYAAFAARVLVSSTEQADEIDDRPPLRQIPVLLRGEKQLPQGPGEVPPSQPAMPGMEPDLPALRDRDPKTIDWVNESADD
jgi:hypothetical protein